jgi:putative copper export protein
MECIKEREKVTREVPELTFTSLDSALSWLRGHKAELIIGTVVVIVDAALRTIESPALAPAHKPPAPSKRTGSC